MPGEVPRRGRGQRGCQELVLDGIIGAAEIAILGYTAIFTAISIPPESAPQGRYQHVVSLYTLAVMVTVLAVLAIFLARRRWVTAVIQVFVVVAAIISVIVLHRVRVSGGLTGF